MLTQKPNGRTFLACISGGRAGVKQTLKIMTSVVRTWKKVPEMREAACHIVISSGISQKDFAGESRAIFYWVRDKIHYLQDIADVETIQTPDYTLHHKMGDCDDKSVLLATLLESIGHKTRFRAVGFDTGMMDHVYVETLIGTVWVPMDTTEPFDMGWAPDENEIVEWAYSHN